MRILLIYPGNLFSTIDVAHGYNRALRERGCDVHAFAYHESLRFYSVALDAWREERPDAGLPEEAYVALASERVAIAAADFEPDIALIVSGLIFGIRGWQLLDRMGVPIAVLLTESPYLDEQQAYMAQTGHARLLFTNDRASVEPLEEMTGLPVHYLPHSYDPARHRPLDVSDEYRSDVFFHGTLWPERQAMFTPLLDLPYRVQIGGINPAQGARQIKPRQIVDNTDLARFYNGTQIALNHHRTCVGAGDELEHIASGTAWSLGPRAYEIAACGAFQLCDDSRPELREVFGDSVPTYANASDLLDKARYFLHHPAERRDLAEEARHRVEGCTFAERAQNIVIPALKEAINGST